MRVAADSLRGDGFTKPIEIFMRVSTLLLSASATSARSCGERESGARADQSVRCQDGADTRVAAGGTYDHISSGRHVASDRPHFEPRWHAYDRCHALGLSRAFRLVPVVEPLLHLAPARARANAALYARGGGRGRRERHAGVSLQEHLCRPECARSEVPSERIDGSQRGRDCAAMARLWHWPCIDWSSVVVWLACDGERLDREAVSDQGEAGGEGGRRQELEALHVHVDLFRVCHLAESIDKLHPKRRRFTCNGPVEPKTAHYAEVRHGPRLEHGEGVPVHPISVWRGRVARRDT